MTLTTPAFLKWWRKQERTKEKPTQASAAAHFGVSQQAMGQRINLLVAKGRMRLVKPRGHNVYRVVKGAKG